MADFYMRTAASLDKLLSNQQSVKAAAAPHPDSKRVLALLVNTLAYRNPLSHVLQIVNVAHLERKTFPQQQSTTSMGGSANGGKHVKARPMQKRNESGRGHDKAQPHAGPPAHAGNAKSSRSAQPSGPAPGPTSASLLLVLSHDLLFSARGIQAAKSWPPKVALERHRARLHSELVKLQLRAGKSRIQDLRAGAMTDSADGRSFDEIIRTIPRWVRVNELKTTVDDVKAWLAERGWKEVGHDGHRTELKAGNEFAVSKYVPSLLAFPPKSTSTLLASELYKEGWIVLQDLASCMPAQILNPLEWEACGAATKASPSALGHASASRGKRKRQEELAAIDATSAPGNKTSHLSALMQGCGHLTAFERSAPRYMTLTKLLARSGALASHDKGDAKLKALGNVTTVNQDFLQTDPQDPAWRNVRYMLVDPSCSGSGIVNRLDYLKADEDEDENEDENDAEEADRVAEETEGDVARGATETGDKRKRSADEVSPLTTITSEERDAAKSEAQQERKSKKQLRLEKLGEFQLLMIRHAMRCRCCGNVLLSCLIHASRILSTPADPSLNRSTLVRSLFPLCPRRAVPSLQRLVYSTCSIHAEENEHVVLRALDCAEAAEHGWRLAPRRQVLPGWPVRGDADECPGRPEVADSVVRCVPGGTKFEESKYANTESCNGFFVACFVRGRLAELVDQGAKAEVGDPHKTQEEEEQAEEGEEERRKRRKTELNRKKAEQKKRREKQKKLEARADASSC
ncbi:hypothetical protein ACQY0O_001935 [Thecaphora frezii]